MRGALRTTGDIASALVWLAALVGGIADVQELRAPWLYVLAGVVAVAVALFRIRPAFKRWRNRWKKIIAAAERAEDLQKQLLAAQTLIDSNGAANTRAAERIGQLEQAAATWQVRAQEAEGKLANWDRENVRLGRRRALGELAASEAETTFDEVQVQELGGLVRIAARVVTGLTPPIGSIFVVLSDVFPESTFLTIRCVNYLHDSTHAVFEVETHDSLNAGELVEIARTTGTLPPHMQITARPRTDDLSLER